MKKRLFYIALIIVVLTRGIRAEGDAPILDKREDPPVVNMEQPVEQKQIDPEKQDNNDDDIYDGDWIGNPFEIYDNDENNNPDDTLVRPNVPNMDNEATKGETGTPNSNGDNGNNGEIDFDAEYRKLLEGGEGDTGNVNEVPYIPPTDNNANNSDSGLDDIVNIIDEKAMGVDKLLEHLVFEKDNKVIILNVDGKTLNTGIYVEETNPELVAEALRQMSVFNGVKVYKTRNSFLLEKDGKTRLISVKSREDIIKEYEGYKDKTQFPKNDSLKNAFSFLETDNLKITIGKALTDGSYKMKDALSVYGNIPIKANGVIVEDDYTTPLVKDDVVLYPIRTVGEALGCEVSWSDPNFMATLKKGNKKIEIRPGNKKVTVIEGDSKKVYELSATPEFKDGRTMVPVALICKVFEGRMYYDDVDRTLVINNKEYKEDGPTQGGSVLITSEPLDVESVKKPAFSDEDKPDTQDETSETEKTDEIDKTDETGNSDNEVENDDSSKGGFDVFDILTQIVKSKFE